MNPLKKDKKPIVRKTSAMEVESSSYQMKTVGMARLSSGQATVSSEAKQSSVSTVGKSFKAPALKDLNAMRTIRN